MDGNKTPPELEITKLRATKILGKGAMGTVFLVHENSHDQPFALKVVEKSPHDHHQANRRARHEISVLRRLSASHHPFLPHLIGSSERDDFFCWAIPFCPGGDLNVLRYRQTDQVFSPAVIRFYLAEIISAIQHLHAQGIVYRDLKPENILVQQSGHVTLTDFDLSRDLASRKSLDVNFHSDPEEEKPAKRHSRISKLTRFVTLKRGGKRAFSRNNPLKKAKSARVSPVSRRNASDFLTNERSNSFVGAEEYVAPEVIQGEESKGDLPENTVNRAGVHRKTQCIDGFDTKAACKRSHSPPGVPKGAAEIKEHEFFRGLRWDLITEVLRPPFLPSREEAEVKEGGVDIWEYYEKVNPPPSPLWSPSPDNSRHNVSLTEF
ncbi:Serine/threonine-protein kinase UCNL [Sesamum angolense]|uniref:non-specific serine/threonine protein kinase n=1 Tax=Sesamum angolense TaxID=2727404 RepID=A0AAE1XBE7_9LAMI|nr:Serine/threonine-protein kinase UCNL [Sesamum angolense]